MKTTKYVGFFMSADNDKYKLEVSCAGFLQAFFLLTADAIRAGKHYQLYPITSEKGEYKVIDDIIKCASLIN